MSRFYTVLAAAFLTVMLLVGANSIFDTDATFSVAENRNLKTQPTVDLPAMLRGEWFEDYLAYYRDTFPQREMLLEKNRDLNMFYNFTALADEDDVQIVIDFQSNAAGGGEALLEGEIVPPSEAVPAESAEPDSPTEPTEPTEQTARPTEPEEPQEPELPAEDLGQAILVGNRAMDVPRASYESIEAYASAVNHIADALGSDVRTFCIDVPNAAAFYAPQDYRTGEHDQKAMIDYCYSRLDSNVLSVDAFPLLQKHKDEYIYFRTDHHWTQLGAYYAYTAYCERAGLTPIPLEQFETGTYEGFVGSMYTYLSAYPQASVLREEPDTLTYYRPFVDLNTVYYTDASLNHGYAIGTICHIKSSVSNKYLTYLGGDHPITVIETDAEGPVCLMLKESYGNAFAPWLTSHYSKIIVIDPREFNREGMPSLDLVSFAEKHSVSDCIILNYPMMLNSSYYADWLNRLVD